MFSLNPKAYTQGPCPPKAASRVNNQPTNLIIITFRKVAYWS